MASRPARGAISRPTLIWIIVAAFLIASGVGVYFAVRTGSRPTVPPGAAISLDAPPPPAPPVERALQSDDGRAQFVDQDDPNRLAGEMLYRRLDPLPRGRYALEEPQLWLFMKDGRTLHVRAARGNVKFFQGTQKPESGRFEGGVIARVYGAGVATPSVRPDASVTTPEMLAYTESMIFDLSLGEFSTQDVVNLSSETMELQGSGLTIVFNEVRGSVASIELGAVGFLHVRTQDANRAPEKETRAEAKPAPAGASPAPDAAPASDAASPPPVAAAAPEPEQPKIDLYATEISGPVQLTVGTEAPQSVSADKLYIWARLIDGQLPPNAIAELRSGAKPKPTPEPDARPAAAPAEPVAGAKPAPAPETPSAPTLRQRLLGLRVNGPGGIEPLTPIADDDALLTWGGKLVAVAVETTPPELDTEHVAGRFVGVGDKPVLMVDARSGATIVAEQAHYGATTATTEFTGAKPPTIADARGGHAELPALTVNLKSGIAQSRGPGYLYRRHPTNKTPSGEPDQQRLEWTDQSDFEFAMSSKDGGGFEHIRSASFSGNVKGTNAESELTGDFLKALFVPSSTGEGLVHRVHVEGNAFARARSAGEPQSLRAATFDLTFEPNEERTESSPSFLVARGGVEATRTEAIADPTDKTKRTQVQSTLASETLEAALGRDARNNTIVTRAVASGNPSFNRSDGAKASGDEISVNVLEQTADITGSPATVSARGATLSAPEIHLDNKREDGPDAFLGVIARGPGRLDHVDPDAGALEEGRRAALRSEEIGRTTLTWTKGMRFNDALGEGDAVGDVVAITHPDPFTRNTIRGSRVLLRTVPSNAAPREEGAATGADPLENLRLRRAEVIADEGAPNATAEQRVYVVDAAAAEGRRLEKLTYIDGPRLIADEENGIFEVPAPGRALVLDHSVADEAPEQTPFGSAGSQGTTLVEWSGSLRMNQREEVADAVGGVRVTHKPLDPAGKPIILNSDAVQVRFKLASKGVPGAEKQKDQLVSVTARGGVRITAEAESKELNADEATYDAANDVIEAAATEPHSAVTFLDKTKGIPTIARKLRWNRRTDQIDIVEPAPGAVPIK